MSRTAHISLFISYFIVAAIVGLTFPGGVLNVEDNGAWLLAGLVFLVGLLLHEMITRRQNEMTALRRLLVLRRAYDGAHEELERMRDEVCRVYEAMESVGERRGRRPRIEGSRDGGQSSPRLGGKAVFDRQRKGLSRAAALPKEVKIEDALDDTAVFGSPPRWRQSSSAKPICSTSCGMRFGKTALTFICKRSSAYPSASIATSNASARFATLRAPSSRRTVISRSRRNPVS